MVQIKGLYLIALLIAVSPIVPCSLVVGVVEFCVVFQENPSPQFYIPKGHIGPEPVRSDCELPIGFVYPRIMVTLQSSVLWASHSVQDPTT